MGNLMLFTEISSLTQTLQNIHNILVKNEKGVSKRKKQQHRPTPNTHFNTETVEVSHCGDNIKIFNSKCDYRVKEMTSNHCKVKISGYI